MTTHTNEKIREFRADALRVSAQLPAVGSAFDPKGVSASVSDAGSGNSAPPKLGELFNVSGSQGFQNEREMGLKSASINGASGSGATASSRIAEQQERETARRKASNDTIMFLQMLEDLAEQIKALEDQIDRYDEQIGATDSLIEILASGGEIDPNDPEHQRLLRLAGIPEEDWGTVTLDDLRKHREELQEQRDKAKDQLDKKVAEGAAYEQAESNWQQGQPVSASTLTTPKAVEEYANRNPDVDLEDLSRRDLLEIRKINLVSEYIARSEHTERDVEWFKAAYAELSLTSDQGVLFENAVDMLVSELADNSREMLLKEDSLDPVLVKYLVEDKIAQLEAKFDLSSPDHLMLAEFAVGDLSEQAQKAILQSSSASAELKAIAEQNVEMGSDVATDRIDNQPI
ncbi:hypothetical protein [Henriciella mobilis]|nr:hypothetical protein [Henriciella mobilis]